jgi:hypothetical protein
MTKWIEFVRDWSKKNGLTYSQALKDPRLKADYKGVSGGTIKDVREAALLLRTRVEPVFPDGTVNKSTPLVKALNALVHSADTIAEQTSIDTRTGRRKYEDNPYSDWDNRLNYVNQKMPNIGTPIEVLEMGFRNYFKRLREMSKEELDADQGDIFIDLTMSVPFPLQDEWKDTKAEVKKTREGKKEAPVLRPDAVAKGKRVYSEDELNQMNREAFWSDSTNPLTKQLLDLRFQARGANMKGDLRKLEKLVENINDFYEEKFAPAVRAYNTKWGTTLGFNPKGGKGGIRFPIEIGEGKDAIKIGGFGLEGFGAGSSRGRVAPEPLAYYEQEGLARLRAERRAREIAEMEAREAQRIAEANERRRAEAEAKKAKKIEAIIRKAEAEAKKREDIESIKAEKMRKQKAIKMAEKDVRYDVSSGSSESDDTEGEGIRKGKIDFEDIKWGSFTEQLNAYNSGKSKKLSLEDFAKMILKDPSKYKPKTVKRARFYLNVLIKKKK